MLIRWIPGYEGQYLATSEGEVFSVKEDQIKALATYSCGSGYRQVVLNGEKKLAHRLVALTFLGAPLPDKEVNHKNSDKEDNRPLNLEWVTHAENIKHHHETVGRMRRANVSAPDVDPDAWMGFIGEYNNKPKQRPSAFRQFLWKQAQEHFNIDADLLETIGV